MIFQRMRRSMYLENFATLLKFNISMYDSLVSSD